MNQHQQHDPLNAYKAKFGFKKFEYGHFFFGLGVQDENILNGVLVEHNHIDSFKWVCINFFSCVYFPTCEE